MRGSPLQNVHLRALSFLCIVVGVGLIIWLGQDYVTFKAWVDRENTLRDWQREHPILIFGLAACTYLVIAWLAIPGAAILTVISGWLFGFWPTLVMVSFMSTAGATLAMLTTRYLLSDWVRLRWNKRLDALDLRSHANALPALFTLRLIPGVPFFLVNVAMGLTRIHPWTFWWVSQLGMLPGTAAYVYLGSSLPSLHEIEHLGFRGVIDQRLVFALVILGISPWIVRWLLHRFSRAEPNDVVG